MNHKPGTNIAAVLSILGATFLLMFGFQNCSEAQFSRVEDTVNGKAGLQDTVDICESGSECESTDDIRTPEDDGLTDPDAPTPDDGTDTPDDGTDMPDDGTDTPDDGTDTPDDGTDTPDDGTDTPDDGTDTPDDGTDTPDDGTDTPDDGTDTPDDGTDTPDDDKPGKNPDKRDRSGEDSSTPDGFASCRDVDKSEFVDAIMIVERVVLTSADGDQEIFSWGDELSLNGFEIELPEEFRDQAVGLKLDIAQSGHYFLTSSGEKVLMDKLPSHRQHNSKKRLRIRPVDLGDGVYQVSVDWESRVFPSPNFCGLLPLTEKQ